MTFEWSRRNGLRWIEASLPHAKAVFSTRLGGVSKGSYAELNLGILTDDDPALVGRNRELLAGAVDRDPGGFAMGLQVHGNGLQVHDSKPKTSAYTTRGSDLAKADAQLTNNSEVTPLVLVADCVPVVVSVPGAVGSIHCGWRGVVAGIVAGAVKTLCQLAQTGPEDVRAVLGPGIGPCCYEIGDEVSATFRERGLGEALDGGRLDLSRAIRSELERAGAAPEAIADVALCTGCNPELFFSHRRDGGATGRQAGIGWLSS